MRKILFTIIASFFFPLSLYAQTGSLSLLYICQDYSVDNDELVRNIRNVITNREDFIVYYLSGNSPTVMNRKTYDESRLRGEIYSISSFPILLATEELQRLSDVIEREAQLEIVVDEFETEKISSRKGYGSIELIFFVGKDFVENDYHNAIVARLLLTENLNGIGGLNSLVTFYPCGADYNEKDVEFDSKYSIITNPSIEK